MHHHAWEDWLLQGLKRLGAGRESKGQRRTPLSPRLGQVEDQVWHINDDELGQVVGQLLWEGTEFPRGQKEDCNSNAVPKSIPKPSFP